MRLTERLAALVADGLAHAEESGALPVAGAVSVGIERPQQPEHGDFSSNVALRLARTMRMSPIAVAEKIVESMPAAAEVGEVWVANPGFINFRVAESWLAGQVAEVRAAGDRFGNVSLGRQQIQVEFVSVNPTGPVHVGHARGAVIGSALANVLEAAGHGVTREYYVNDGGNQMRVFNETLYARYMQAAGHDEPLPEPAYEGEYLIDLAEELFREVGAEYAQVAREEAIQALAPKALARTLHVIRDDLAALGVQYDVWFSERSLLRDGTFDDAIRKLEEAGFIVDRDGARWFASTQLGEDRDSVVIRAGGGGATYFGTDIAYHYNKFAVRGFDRVIVVIGADHHGHVPRMKAVMSALGYDPDRLGMILNQIVSFKRSGESVRFSKRRGVIVTLRDLVEEVGSDACRYIFLSRRPDSQMEFDIDMAVRQSMENPVYYVQYAHARIASILRLAGERKIDFSDGDLRLLKEPREFELIRKVIDLPEVVANAADRMEPTQLPYFAYELARVFQAFYEECRVLSDDPDHLPLAKARLKLVDAARISLARALGLMGMTAPEQM